MAVAGMVEACMDAAARAVVAGSCVSGGGGGVLSEVWVARV